MAEWVQQQIVAYGQNRFIITSRPYGYRDNPIDGVTVLEVRPFTPDQVERFVQNWYMANELKSWGRDDPGVHLRVREGAQDLLRRLHHAPALLTLAVNPLLLTMIATIHRYRSSLPGKRVTLYAEICEVFLGKRQEARGIAQELTAAQKQQVLQPLAYHMMQQGTRNIIPTEAHQVIAPSLALVNADMHPDTFLQLVQNTSGLLLERNPEIYSFAHLTFQEYLAAVHIKEAGLEHLLVSQIGTTWWHETIRLYCAQADATALIGACLAEDCPSVPALTLAFECQQEALKVQPSVRSQLDALLETGIEDTDPERRRLVAEVLLTRRVQQMIHLYDETYADTSLVTCAEYQVFLDDQRTPGIYHQPDHWEADSFPLGQGYAPVLGVRPSDATAFCTWLTERDLGTWRYRLPKEGEREKIEGDKSVVTGKLTAGTGYWINEGMGFAWIRGTLLPLDRINSMIRDLFDRDHDRALTYALDHTFSFTHDRDFTLDLDLPRALAHDLTFDLTRDLALDRTFDRALNLDRPLNLTHILDLDRNRAFNRALNRTLNLDGVPSRDRDLPFALDLGRALDFQRDRTYALELERVLDLNLNRALKRDRSIKPIDPINPARSHLETKDEAEFLRWYIRFSAQVLALYLRYWSLRARDSRTQMERLLDLSRNQSHGNEGFELAIRSYLDIYMTFALLEKRIQRMLPAWEGILLVKERKQENLNKL